MYGAYRQTKTNTYLNESSGLANRKPVKVAHGVVNLACLPRTAVIPAPSPARHAIQENPRRTGIILAGGEGGSFG